MNLDKKSKPLKVRIKNPLWLQYGINDRLSEAQIDKIMATFDKVKVDMFWVKTNNRLIKFNDM